MKILFVCSGNSVNGINSIVKNQGESLKDQGIDLSYFPIIGKGISGYLKVIPKLRRKILNEKIDIVHAHYSHSAYTSALAGGAPIVVSLMGSDILSRKFDQRLIKIFGHFLWSSIIVKSFKMKEVLSLDLVNVVPNGVDFEKFKPMNKELAKKHLNWSPLKKHILFAGNPSRKEKNFYLAKKAFDQLEGDSVQLHFLNNTPYNEMPYYYNASDVVILTSLWEGSPNVIKEAMACNIPIVSTNVGDVKNIIEKTNGCYLASFNSNEIALKVRMALQFEKRTTGRNDIKHLRRTLVAKNIISIYEEILKKNKRN